MGIALPKWIVDDGYGKYTLIFYLALLGIILPYYAGKWWYGTQKVTKDGILVNSAGALVREYDDEISEGGLLSALSAGYEYESVLSGDRADAGLSRAESAILSEGELSKYVGGLSAADKKKLQELSNDSRRKVLSL